MKGNSLAGENNLQTVLLLEVVGGAQCRRLWEVVGGCWRLWDVV